MKKYYQLGVGAVLLFLLILNNTTPCNAQEKTHTGFYLSMQTGPAFGYINGKGEYGDGNQDFSLRVSGTGFGLDFQIGGAIKENIILHGTIGFKTIFGPEIDYGTTHVKISQDYSFDELMIVGIGTTYYMQKNFFLTGNLGIGQFSLSDESSNTTVDTGSGFSYQLKAGKEWWVSSRWALGAAIEYGGTYTKDTMSDYEERWQSHRYSVRFTATMNGRKN